MSATRKVAKLRALSPVERRVLGQALLLLPATCAGLRIAGLKRTRDWLTGMTRRAEASQGIDARSVARIVSIAARHGPVRARCLSASLTLESLLRRYGHDAELRLGVRRRDGRFEAHAWIEHGGAAMDACGVADGFAPFADLPER